MTTKTIQNIEKLESITQDNQDIQNNLKVIENYIKNQKKLLEKLSLQFPNIKVFKEYLQYSDDALMRVASIEEKNNNTDSILEAIEFMKYQEIYRQKIQRIADATIILSKCLDSIINDEKEVSVSNEEIEELVSLLEKK